MLLQNSNNWQTPNEDDRVVFAMDALFGLPRKKSAGMSYRGPLHADLFFYQQSSVDQYVAERSLMGKPASTVSRAMLD